MSESKGAGAFCLHWGVGLLVWLLASACGENPHQPVREEVSKLRREVRELKQLKHDVRALEREMKAQKQQQPKDRRRESPLKTTDYNPDGSHLDDPFLGPADAPVLIMAFSEYQCRPCRDFYQRAFPKLRQEFIQTKQVKYVFRDFPLASHQLALTAANLAHCSGEQGRYWRAHEVLFENPQVLDNGEVTNLLGLIGEVDVERLKRCIESRRYDKEVHRDVAEGTKLGAKGPPGFFVGRKTSEDSYRGVLIRGAQPYPVFRKQIVKLLAAGEPLDRLENN